MHEHICQAYLKPDAACDIFCTFAAIAIVGLVTVIIGDKNVAHRHYKKKRECMKKLIALFIAFVCVSGLIGCNQGKGNAVTGDLPPMLNMGGEHYLAKAMPISELPDDFEYMGEITADEANDTGLQGCKYYANKHISSFDEFYVYQECGTPIDESTIDSTQRQWAYVKWVREGFERD